MMNKVRFGHRMFSHCRRQSNKFRVSERTDVINRNFQTVTDSQDIEHVPISQVRRILDYRNVQYTEGYACLIAQDCPLECVDRKPNKKFYINKTTGLFVCHACGRSTTWSWMERRLKEPGVRPLAAHTPLQSAEPIDSCFPVATAPIADIRHCLTALNLQHVTVPMLAQLGACIDRTGPKLLLPLRGGPDDSLGAWVALTSSPTDSPNEEIIGLKAADVATSPLLLASGATWTSEEAVLVPSVADFLALTSKSIPAIYIAAGSRHLPQEVLPLLEQFTKLTLWFGKNTDAARSFARKLGESRCFLVRPREGLGSAHEAALSKEKKQQLLAVVKEAKAVLHPAVISFADIRADVRSELERSDLALGIPWQRFPKLTSYLGGFRRGELTILTGPTGCGKTTFMSEFSLDLVEQGVNTMWGSFEIRNSRLARTMLTQLAGENLEKNMERFEEVADLMETMPLHFMAFHGQQPLKKVMEVVQHATYVHDLGHIVIDNVQFMLGVGNADGRQVNRFHLQDIVIEAFRNHATSTNCHVTLVMHPRKEITGDLLSVNSIYGNAKASQDADNVLILQDQTTFPGGRRFIQVAKNRYNGILGNMTLIFDRESMCYNKKKKGDPVKGVLEGEINVAKPGQHQPQTVLRPQLRSIPQKQKMLQKSVY